MIFQAQEVFPPKLDILVCGAKEEEKEEARKANGNVQHDPSAKGEFSSQRVKPSPHHEQENQQKPADKACLPHQGVPFHGIRQLALTCSAIRRRRGHAMVISASGDPFRERRGAQVLKQAKDDHNPENSSDRGGHCHPSVEADEIKSHLCAINIAPKGLVLDVACKQAGKGEHTRKEKNRRDAGNGLHLLLPQAHLDKKIQGQKEPGP